MPNTRTHDHKVTSVNRQSRHEACRMAVLGSLLGEGYDRDDVAGGLDAVRGMWRRRLDELRSRDAPFLDGDSQFWNAHYCNPFGVDVVSPSNSCDMSKVCPFCWARRNVLDLFVHMELLVFGTLKPGGAPVLPDGTVMLEFHRRRHLSSSLNTWNLITREKVHDYLIRLMRNRYERATETRHYGADLGGFVFQTAAPAFESVTYRRSGLLLVPGDSGPFTLPPSRHREMRSSLRVHRVLTRRRLVGAVSRVCRYPPTLLVDPELTGDLAVLLHRMRGLRMFTKHGLRDAGPGGVVPGDTETAT